MKERREDGRVACGRSRVCVCGYSVVRADMESSMSLSSSAVDMSLNLSYVSGGSFRTSFSNSSRTASVFVLRVPWNMWLGHETVVLATVWAVLWAYA